MKMQGVFLSENMGKSLILSGKIAFCAALWYAFCVDTERGENHDF